MPSKTDVFTKCAWRLIPFSVLLFTINFIDRVNVGFAALTMNRDLSFTPSVFGFGAGVFFLGYFAFEIPSNLILARIGARRWICLIMALWAAISAACAFVHSEVQFYVLRFSLGIAEAGFFPGLLFYLTLWFPRSYRGRFAASLIAAGPLAGVVGGPLSGLILGMDGISGLHGWQWLFLIEGLPACIAAFFVLEFMPDGPANVFWLTEEEKDIIARKLAAEAGGKKYEFWPALVDFRVLILSIALLGMQSGLFGIGFWLPQIVQSMGFSVLLTGFVIVPPYLASAIAMFLWGRASDRAGERMWHLVLAAFLGSVGLFAASALQNNLLVLIALTIGMIGVHSTFGPFWGIPSSFLGGNAAAGGVALINSIGSLGGFLAPALIGVLRQYTGDYRLGMALLAGELLASGLIMLALGYRSPSVRGYRVTTQGLEEKTAR